MKVKIVLIVAILLPFIACHSQEFQPEFEKYDPAHFKMSDARFHKPFFKNVRYNRYLRVLDTRKDQLLAKKYSATLCINDQLLRVKTEDHYGLVNEQYKVIVPFLYGSISCFKEGENDAYAKVATKSGKYGYINSTGQVIIDTTYNQSIYFWEGLFHLHKDGKYGFVNEQMELVTPYVYDSIVELNREFYVLKKGALFGALGKNNEIKIPFIYEDFKMGDYRNGKESYYVKKDGLYGIIEESGDYLLAPMSEQLFEPILWNYAGKDRTNYSSYLQNDKYGIVNSEGKVLTDALFDALKPDYKNRRVVAKIGEECFGIHPETLARTPIDCSAFE